MDVRATITDKLTRALQPRHLEVIDESHGHSVPRGAQSHFRVIAVADAFAGMPRVRRHQRIYELLTDELAGSVHALAIEALTPEQWEQHGGPRLDAPPCRGGSKHDRDAR